MKVMRGFFWSIFLFCAFAVIATVIANFCGVKELGLGSTSANIIASVVCALYIAAYFIVPTFFKSPVKDAAPAVNLPLSAPAYLTVVRDPSLAGGALPILISLNGQQVCSLVNGASATLALTTSHNVLTTNAVGSSKVRYEFDAAPGAVGEIHVKGGVFLPKTMHWNA